MGKIGVVRAMSLLGKTDQLDRSAWLLLIISGLFAISTALSNTFVNVYLWKIKEDYMMIGRYNLASYLAMAVTFIFAGRLAKQVDRVIAIRIGVALQAIFYLAVLALGKNTVQYVDWLGLFLGLGLGFFWLSFNVLYFEITERHNRDIFNGVNGLLTSAAGIMAPLISGFIITRIDQFTGYRIIFSLSLAIFVVAVIISFLLKRRSAHGVFRLKETLEESLQRGRHWFWVNLAMVAQGVREGLFSFLLSLLIFVATKNEMALGWYLTTTSAVSLLSYFLVGRYLRRRWRDEGMLLGTAMMGIMALPLLWEVNAFTLYLLGVGASLFFPIYMVPLTSAVFDVIGENNNTAKRRVEYVVARELALNVGRILSVAVFLWWASTEPDLIQIKWLLIPVAFVQLFSWLTIRQVPLLEQP